MHVLRTSPSGCALPCHDLTPVTTLHCSAHLQGDCTTTGKPSDDTQSPHRCPWSPANPYLLSLAPAAMRCGKTQRIEYCTLTTRAPAATRIPTVGTSPCFLFWAPLVRVCLQPAPHHTGTCSWPPQPSVPTPLALALSSPLDLKALRRTPAARRPNYIIFTLPISNRHSQINQNE